MNNSAFTVILKRVVAVNSASFAYVEVPLDLNIVLLGTGNLGKSSIVNAVRFFLLPEVNVNDSDKKFAFISGAADGADVSYFTKDQIYEYYFPSEDSRLILEVEHCLLGGATRRHCQIISRADNYRLQRCFIAEEYESIGHLFWDKKGEAGGRPANPPGRQLLPLLKNINGSTKQISQVEQLERALYHVDVLRPDTCPYVVFPLHDIRKNSVDSLRALVKMLFNQDNRSLRLMAATAIEARDDSSQILEVDIGEIINEQKALRARKHVLERLKEAQPRYDALKSKYQQIIEENSVAEAFAKHWVNTQSFKEKIEKDIFSIAESKKAADESVNELKSTKDKLDRDTAIHEHRIKDLSINIKRHLENKDACEVICQPYFGMSRTEVLEVLKKDLQDKTNDLNNYTDGNARKRRLESLQKEITEKERSLTVLQEKKNNKVYNLKEQLDSTVWNKLFSVSSDLAKANPGRTLTDVEYRAVQGFTDLLEVHGPNLDFFDESIPFLTEPPSESIEDQISDAKSELRELKQEQRELSAIDRQQSLHDIKKIEDVRKAIHLLNIDIQKLESSEHIAFQLLTDNEEKLSKTEIINGLKAKLETLKPAYQTALDTQYSLKSQQEILQEEVKRIDKLLSNYQFMPMRFTSVKTMLQCVERSQSESETGDEKLLSKLAKQLEEAEIAKRDVYTQLCSMITSGLITDDNQLLEGRQDEDAILKTFLAIASLYDLLIENHEVLARDTRSHNDHVRNRLERLSKTKEKVDFTVAQINSELTKAKVNDLESVKLNVILNAHFEDLINSWREFDDLSTEGTLPEEWYMRLKQFLQSDAVNQTDGKLRMENIVKQARYMTKKPGDIWDDKDQSTSTKMLINMHFCDIFIQQLSSETSNVAFPLIMDEIGKVSSEQFPNLIKGLNQKGHWLIGVTTHGKSGDLIAPFRNYLIMDELKTAEPYSRNRRHVCYPLDIEQIVVKEQPSLLEEA